MFNLELVWIRLKFFLQQWTRINDKHVIRTQQSEPILDIIGIKHIHDIRHFQYQINVCAFVVKTKSSCKLVCIFHGTQLGNILKINLRLYFEFFIDIFLWSFLLNLVNKLINIFNDLHVVLISQFSQFNSHDQHAQLFLKPFTLTTTQRKCQTFLNQK